jgi:hypothetical protein
MPTFRNTVWFHLQRQVDDVRLGWEVWFYLYRAGFRQDSGRGNGKVWDRLVVVGRGEVYQAYVGGANVLYSLAVSFPCVFSAVVSGLRCGLFFKFSHSICIGFKLSSIKFLFLKLPAHKFNRVVGC